MKGKKAAVDWYFSANVVSLSTTLQEMCLSNLESTKNFWEEYTRNISVRNSLFNHQIILMDQ